MTQSYGTMLDRTIAELIALHDMLRHILWIRDVAVELDLLDDKSKPVSTQQDNMPAISAVTSDLGSMQGRSKYIVHRQAIVQHPRIHSQKKGDVELTHVLQNGRHGCRPTNQTEDMVAY